jgi:hypothetical protein
MEAGTFANQACPLFAFFAPFALNGFYRCAPLDVPGVARYIAPLSPAGKEHLLMAKPRRRRKIGSKKRKARRDRRKR